MGLIDDMNEPGRRWVIRPYRKDSDRFHIVRNQTPDGPVTYCGRDVWRRLAWREVDHPPRPTDFLCGLCVTNWRAERKRGE